MERCVSEAAKLEGKCHLRLWTLDMELLDLVLVFAVFRSGFGPVFPYNPCPLYFKLAMNILCQDKYDVYYFLCDFYSGLQLKVSLSLQ